MQNKQKDYSILLLLIILLSAIAVSSKPITFRDCNKVTAPLRCKAIKSNGKQCMNASHKCDTVCKYHLNNIK